ncbi:hypothetical protein ACFV30_29160 [Streptomyces sp. NPDC059752]|uniref:hypothetical protein n=1 Tax=unclassified Streptomyces TaxID=2593676 RepID=UPI003657C01B
MHLWRPDALRGRCCSMGAGASSATTTGSGNARRDSARIAAVCRSTAAAIPGSTRESGAAWRCANPIDTGRRT